MTSSSQRQRLEYDFHRRLLNNKLIEMRQQNQDLRACIKRLEGVAVSLDSKANKTDENLCCQDLHQQQLLRVGELTKLKEEERELLARNQQLEEIEKLRNERQALQAHNNQLEVLTNLEAENKELRACIRQIEEIAELHKRTAKLRACNKRLEAHLTRWELGEEIEKLREENAELLARNHQLDEKRQPWRRSAQSAPDVAREQSEIKPAAISKQKTSLHVDDFLLLESLRWLTRWELDGMSLASRQLCTTVLDNNGAGLPQRRMMRRLEWSSDLEKRLTPYTVLFENGVGAKYTKVFTTFEKGDNIVVEGDALYVSSHQLSTLFTRSPFLHAREATLCGSNFAGFSMQFASILEGSPLVLRCRRRENERLELPPAKLLHACSLLCIKTDNARVGNWKETVFHAPTSAASPTNPPHIVIEEGCTNISYEVILDYLFASASDGRKRELSLGWLDYPAAERHNFADTYFRQLLEERLATAPSTPIFSLKLLVDLATETPMLGIFELHPSKAIVAEGQMRGGCGTASKLFESAKRRKNAEQHHCTVVVAISKANRRFTEINVECA